MQRRFPVRTFALGLALLAASGCGTSFTLGEGMITVNGLAPGQALLCGSNASLMQISGSGFLSEHGNQVLITFTALDGTPFDGSATQEIVGTALSDSLIEVQVPSATGTVEATIRVTLPGSNSGVSEPATFEIGGTLVGPFGNTDFFGDATGNVTYNASAPGVLGNDDPSFCADEEEYEVTPEKPAATGSSGTRIQNLFVETPPPGFPDDAEPGVVKPTALGGTVLIQGDGSFAYEPPLGRDSNELEGDDFFDYWVSEPGRPMDRARVFLTVNKVVWFIDDGAMPGGSGRFSDPYDSLTSFNAQQGGGNPDQPEPGDCIFVYENSLSLPYDDGITLLDDQKLFGQGVDLMLNGNLIVAKTDKPRLTNTGAAIGETSGGFPIIVLANRNEVQGLIAQGPIDSTALTGAGIYGSFVSGPTFIDQVVVQAVGGSGILLQECSGPYQIGTPAGPIGQVLIEFVGNHGIEIQSQGATFGLEALVGGVTVTVDGASIQSPNNNGVEAFNANVEVRRSTIDDPYVGVNYGNFAFGSTCDVTVHLCDIGLSGSCRYRGIFIQPFDGLTRAAISSNSVRAQSEAVYAGVFSQGSGSLEIALDGNDASASVGGAFLAACEIVGSTTTVTSMASNVVIGGGTGGGLRCSDVTFDADTGAGGVQQVTGGGTTIGSMPGLRVQDTALGLYDCSGDLRFTSLVIRQQGGSPTGIANTGTLTLSFATAPVVDHIP